MKKKKKLMQQIINVCVKLYIKNYTTNAVPPEKEP